MTLYDIPIHRLDGSESSLGDFKGQAALIVNVASKCGLTPQYTGLEKIHEQYADRGFTVLGFPCNQFGGQEPGSAEEIETFCSVNYGVTFPLFEKIDVNGDGKHPIYAALEQTPDADDGHVGDIRWNFEKFVLSPEGEVVARFSPMVEPEAPQLIETIEKVLPK
jgi:glutathione peroxidase